MKIKLEVKGMSCKHCENRVVDVLSSVEGIKKVKASSSKDMVKVDFDEAIVDVGYIADKIKEAGYEVGNEKG